MKRFFSGVVLFSSVLGMSHLAADTVESAPDQLDDVEVKAVREWINTKRQVSVKEVGGNLSISGEVSAEFQTTNEKVNGVRQRAPGGATDVFARGMEICYKLMFDYRTDRTWLASKLRFKNKAGLFGGNADKIRLEKAYWGLRFLQKEALTLDVELGRRGLGSMFDSKIEFIALFDGVLLKYDQGFETVGNFYVHGGAFIIDQRKDHLGYVGELGLLDVANTGLFAKYSLIDWDTKRTNYKRLERRKFDFLVSQVLLGYRCVPKSWDKEVKVYFAGLYNHCAKPREITDWSRAAWGGYAGFIIGRTRKKADWSLEASYQVVAAQAVPYYDVGGVGIGNAADAGFYFNEVDHKPVATTRKTAAGNTNWQGYTIIFNYLVTDNINIKQVWNQSSTLNHNIGPLRRYKQYEVDFIYAF